MGNNNQNQLTEEEISNIEKLQEDRNSSKNTDSPDEFEGEDDNREDGYTNGETEFADGEGTQLNKETANIEYEEDTHKGEPGDADANFDNPDDDPA